MYDRFLGRHVDQGPQRRTGLLQGARLQKITEQKQKSHNGRFRIFADEQRADDRNRHQQLDAESLHPQCQVGFVHDRHHRDERCEDKRVVGSSGIAEGIQDEADCNQDSRECGDAVFVFVDPFDHLGGLLFVFPIVLSYAIKEENNLMGVKLWMRKCLRGAFAKSVQEVSGRSSGEEVLAGVRPTFKACAPTRTCSQEKGPQITAVLRRGMPHRRRAPNRLLGGIRTQKNCLQIADS